MFKSSDIKVGDILIANNTSGSEYKVLEVERREDACYFYIENLQTKVRSRLRIREENEAKAGIAKIIHA